MKKLVRSHGRQDDQLRPIKIVHYPFGFAPGSVLLQMGKTKVFCAVTIQTGVPPFLRGKNTGWLHAEYAMMPTATYSRTPREIFSMKRSGRSTEISRLISRALRSVIDLKVLGERTIVVDCDVVQADGGTRTAAITGAGIALELAQQCWLKNKTIDKPFLIDSVAAVSVGVVQDRTLLDLDFSEDSKALADFNFVLTRSDKIIEIQGGVEGHPLAWDQFDAARKTALKGVKSLWRELERIDQRKKNMHASKESKSESKVPLFSLKNRQESTSNETT